MVSRDGPAQRWGPGLDEGPGPGLGGGGFLAKREIPAQGWRGFLAKREVPAQGWGGGSWPRGGPSSEGAPGWGPGLEALCVGMPRVRPWEQPHPPGRDAVPFFS